MIRELASFLEKSKNASWQPRSMNRKNAMMMNGADSLTKSYKNPPSG